MADMTGRVALQCSQTSAPIGSDVTVRDRTKEKTPTPGKQYTLVPKTDVVEATREIVNTIQEKSVEIKIKNILAAGGSTQKAISGMLVKSRRPYSARRAEGGILAVRDKNFSVQAVPEEDLKTGLGVASLNLNEIFVEYVQLEEDAINISTLNFDDYHFVVDKVVDILPEGAVVIEDPVVQYYDSLAPGEKPKQIYTSVNTGIIMESQGIPDQIYQGMSSGPVFPCINDKQDIESILDMGSQIHKQNLFCFVPMGTKNVAKWSREKGHQMANNMPLPEFSFSLVTFGSSRN
ncbi:hypothetical protein B0H19DRAFT_1071737 [Mycena capillaripes]|nr:hypothetical protein B0H19DRAFT_1071737 [Mycena capillaripes]